MTAELADFAPIGQSVFCHGWPISSRAHAGDLFDRDVSQVSGGCVGRRECGAWAEDSGVAEDPRRDVHGDPSNVVVEQFALAGVDASADLDAQCLGVSLQRLWTRGRTRFKAIALMLYTYNAMF